MYNKLFAVFAALCAVLLAPQTASCEDEVKQPDELYIINPGSAFPYIVTDPNNPILDPSLDSSLDRRVVRICIVSQCQSVCKSWGYKFGRCNTQAVCVCSQR